MRRISILFISSFIIFAAAAPAFAQQLTFSIRTEDSGQIDPKTGLAYKADPEPTIPLVVFKKIEPARSLQERIGRLVEGITTDIPPEYDYYGYEIRRYMAHVGAPEIYQHSGRLLEEQNNVAKARAIFAYWQDYLSKETADIKAEIDKGNVSSSVLDSFKYNSGVVTAFEIECQAWLNNNEALLDFLAKDKGAYVFEDPKLTFNDGVDRNAFFAVFVAREKARREMLKYHAFAQMVY